MSQNPLLERIVLLRRFRKRDEPRFVHEIALRNVRIPTRPRSLAERVSQIFLPRGQRLFVPHRFRIVRRPPPRVRDKLGVLLLLSQPLLIALLPLRHPSHVSVTPAAAPHRSSRRRHRRPSRSSPPRGSPGHRRRPSRRRRRRRHHSRRRHRLDAAAL